MAARYGGAVRGRCHVLALGTVRDPSVTRGCGVAELLERSRGTADERELTCPLLSVGGMIVGLFDCPPGDPLWKMPNYIGSASLVAFPGTPVVIARPGIGAFCADRNQAVVYAAGQEYRRASLHPRGDVCSYVVLSAETLDGALPRRDLRALFRAGRCVVPGPSWLRYQIALARMRGGGLDPVGFEEQVLSVVGDVFDSAGTGGAGYVGTRMERRVEGVRERLSSDLEFQVTVHDVAREFGVSPFHLVRQFKELTGWTMHGYRTQLRLRTAAELMLDSAGRGLADIAAMTGFASHSHMTARFGRAFGGMTPSALRSAVRAVPEPSSNIHS